MPADTYSSNLRILFMGDGNDNNTWGDNTNTNLGLFEDVVTKRVDLAVGGQAGTPFILALTTANGASDQARSLSLSCTGAMTSNVAIQVPSGIPKVYIVDNKASGSFVLTIQQIGGGGIAGSTVTCAQGIATIVYCDGQGNCKPAQAFGGAASLSVAQNWTAGQAVTPVLFAEGSPTVLNASLSNNFYGTFTAARTFSITNILDGEEINVVVTQGGSAGYQPTWPGNVIWAQGLAPVFSSIVGARDKVRLQYFSVLNLYIGEVISNAAAVATYNVVASGTQFNVNLFNQIGSPAGAVTVNYTIPAGTIIKALSTKTYALDLSGFTTGSTINLINNGWVLGKGGNAGEGGSLYRVSSTALGSTNGGGAGFPGGPAIKLPLTGVTVNIVNANGQIFSGGGGGGGGGVVEGDTTTNHSASGGGGGGGAGGGSAGMGKDTQDPQGSVDAKAANGTDGADGQIVSGANGASGAGANSGTATGSAGGAGGDWGAKGSDGAGGKAGLAFAGTVAGFTAAGIALAIYLNGNAISSFTGSTVPNTKGPVA